MAEMDDNGSVDVEDGFDRDRTGGTKEIQAVTRVDSGDRITAKPEAAQNITPHEGECQRNNGIGDGSGNLGRGQTVRPITPPRTGVEIWVVDRWTDQSRTRMLTW